MCHLVIEQDSKLVTHIYIRLEVLVFSFHNTYILTRIIAKFKKKKKWLTVPFVSTHFIPIREVFARDMI